VQMKKVWAFPPQEENPEKKRPAKALPEEY
jgi:hypothetical protein